MLTKEKITHFIYQERNTFHKLPDPCFIIGSAGLLLSGLLIANVSDLDILTTRKNYEIIKKDCSKYIHTEDHLDNGKKFESYFLRLNSDGMIVEVMAELFVNTNIKWQKVEVIDSQKLVVGDVTILYPTLVESIRLLNLFTREKDKTKLARIEHHLIV